MKIRFFLGYEDYFLVATMGSTIQGLPFDQNSITLMDTNTFSKNNKEPLFLIRHLPRDAKKRIKNPSDLDILHLNLLYCEGDN